MRYFILGFFLYFLRFCWLAFLFSFSCWAYRWIISKSTSVNWWLCVYLFKFSVAVFFIWLVGYSFKAYVIEFIYIHMFIWDNWTSLQPPSVNLLILFRLSFCNSLPYSILLCGASLSMVIFHTISVQSHHIFHRILLHFIAPFYSSQQFCCLYGHFGCLFACMHTIIAIDSWLESVNLCNLKVFFILCRQADMKLLHELPNELFF